MLREVGADGVDGPLQLKGTQKAQGAASVGQSDKAIGLFRSEPRGASAAFNDNLL